MSAGSFIYAGDFNDYYPITTVGSGNASGQVQNYNHLAEPSYARYVEYENQVANISPPINTQVPTQYEPWNQNLGFLYAGQQVANPLVFYCPALLNPTLQYTAYSTPVFMSTAVDANNASSGVVRSSYLYNPREVNGQNYNGPPGANDIRKYQKTTDAKQLDIFITDYLENPAMDSPPPPPFNASQWSHWPSKGLITCFTDGSARFIQFSPYVFNLITVSPGLTTDENSLSAGEYDYIFNFLQNAQ
jgi:hypothetical protein